MSAIPTDERVEQIAEIICDNLDISFMKWGALDPEEYAVIMKTANAVLSALKGDGLEPPGCPTPGACSCPALKNDDGLAEARMVVELQAQDDGLWFKAETCAEAYLQAELRRLHATIERDELSLAMIAEQDDKP